jgi:hypothetical protein
VAVSLRRLFPTQLAAVLSLRIIGLFKLFSRNGLNAARNAAVARTVIPIIVK